MKIRFRSCADIVASAFDGQRLDEQAKWRDDAIMRLAIYFAY